MKLMEISKVLDVITIKTSMNNLRDMKDIDLIIFKMDKGLWNILTDLNIMEIGWRGKEIIGETIFWPTRIR